MIKSFLIKIFGWLSNRAEVKSIKKEKRARNYLRIAKFLSEWKR
tara:strand:- start:8842 stop:8973 length:132 start_codon:yes stop_codon:yes gene_type:complete